MIDKTILHYKIIEELGRGGMGVVYKADDMKLKRTVAIKFLPRQIAASEEDRERFKIEAQAAAAPNHPNIATIYNIEEVDDEMFIVMEYIDGRELKELSIDNYQLTIDYATQIASGLQAAHAKGIVHRDIKSSNIMITDDGKVKIMDFGLAKIGVGAQLTKDHSTLGTTAYMSPEQARGDEADQRSDIWSFGVVLYEMLTGTLPFKGEYEQAVIYSILNEGPEPVEKHLPDISAELLHIINRVLEKDPNDRYQHFDDIVVELRRLQKITDSVMQSSEHTADAPISSTQIATSRRSSVTVNRKPAFLISLAIAIITIVLAFWLMSGPSHPEINPNMEFSNLRIPAVEYQYPGISHDGKWLAFPASDLNGNWDIYMMFIETGENKRITTDSSLAVTNASTARFSPDGSSIAFGRKRRGSEVSEICVVSVLSGLVRVIADTGIHPQWSPSGDRIYYYRSNLRQTSFRSRSGWREYWSVSPQGGDARIEFIDSLAQGSIIKFTLCVSPDGKKIAFTRPFANGHNEIFIRNIETGEVSKLTDDDQTIDEVVWTNNGLIFYTSNKSSNFNIWAIPETGGEPIQVTRGTGPDFGISISTAANRLVYSQRTNVGTLWMVNTDGTGNRQVYPDENILGSSIAPDRNSVALTISHPLFYSTLMLRELSGGRQEILIPFDSTTGRANPIWSPDGNSLAYLEYRKGSNHIKAKIMDFAGGRRIRDFGEGVVEFWQSDSVVLIFRNSAADHEPPDYNSPKILNLNTVKESVFFRDTVLAGPVMDNTAILYFSDDEWRYLTTQEFRRDPLAEGRFIINKDEAKNIIASDLCLYYRSAKTGTLWKLDYRTFKRSKILDIPLSTNIRIGVPDYNDKIITYSVRRLKTNIVKIDKVFVE